MTIAVTGSTGQLGRIVIEKLKSKIPAAEIVALARDPAKADDLGVAARAADYDKPDTLDAALADVDTLLLISANEVGKRTPQHRNVIDAAKRANVGRIVYTSLLRADSSSLSLAAEHRETEALLKASGIPYTILRNGWYTENYLGSVAGALATGTLAGAAGDGRISSASRADYAEAAVAVLTSEGHEGKTYELAGDDAWTLSDLAAEISRKSGKQIPYLNLTTEAYAVALAGSGLPALLADMIAGWDASAAEGALFEDGRELSRLIGRPTTSLADIVADAV